jgi:hypothetical protein
MARGHPTREAQTGPRGVHDAKGKILREKARSLAASADQVTVEPEPTGRRGRRRPNPNDWMLPLIGMAKDGDASDVASNKHDYLADAYLGRSDDSQAP